MTPEEIADIVQNQPVVLLPKIPDHLTCKRMEQTEINEPSTSKAQFRPKSPVQVQAQAQVTIEEPQCKRLRLTVEPTQTTPTPVQSDPDPDLDRSKENQLPPETTSDDVNKEIIPNSDPELSEPFEDADVNNAFRNNVAARSVPQPPEPAYFWRACVLWDAKVLEKMKLNEKSQYEAYTMRGMGKMLCKPVFKESGKQLDWRKPFILLEIVEKQIKCDDEDRLSIRVAEKTWLKIKDTPVNQRLWDLILPKDLEPIASEIIRLSTVKTTVMIWDFAMKPFKRPIHQNDDLLLGQIRLDLIRGVSPKFLIYYHEDIHVGRRFHIQSQFMTSELKAFYKPKPTPYRLVTHWRENPNSLQVHVAHRNRKVPDANILRRMQKN